MLFITLNELKDQFPISEIPIGEGTYASVYPTVDGKYVIKIITDEDYDINSLARELDSYATLDHPCIMKVVAWSHYRDKGYIILPRGINIRRAYRDGLISIEKIVNDTLSAIGYMNTLGMAHCDIKPENIVFHDNKAKFIDFGLVRRCLLTSSGDYCLKGAAYTPYFKDPEYIEMQWGNISAELYALAATYFTIATNKLIRIKKWYTFKTGIPHVDWFLRSIQCFQNKRPNIITLINSIPEVFKIEKHIGIIPDQPKIIIIRNYDELYKQTLVFLCDMMIHYECRSNSLFLAINLFHRSCGIIFPSVPDLSDLRILAIMCMDLACTFCVDVKFEYKVLISYAKLSCTCERLNEMSIEILKAVDYRIYTYTYWDFAKCSEDLPQLLKDTCSFDYNISYMRPSCGKDSCKYVKASTIYTKETLLDEEKCGKAEECVLSGCNLYITQGYSEVEKIWTDTSSNPEIRLAVLLHNRRMLGLVNYNIALSIYHQIFQWNYSNILDLILKFNWRKYTYQQVKDLNRNPFSITDDLFEKKGG